MTVTGPFDMNAEYKDFKFHAYTDFYDMDRTTAVNNKEGYVVVVPIMSSDEKAHCNLELNTNYSLPDFLSSFDDIPCYTVFIYANFFAMHDLLCTLYSLILRM